MAKEDGVVAGLEVAEFVFGVVDASLTCELLAADGDRDGRPARPPDCGRC